MSDRETLLLVALILAAFHMAVLAAGLALR
jgi:hypothetical protein